MGTFSMVYVDYIIVFGPGEGVRPQSFFPDTKICYYFRIEYKMAIQYAFIFVYIYS